MDLRIHVLVWHIEAGAHGRLKYTNKFLETKSWHECYSGRNAVCLASADVFQTSHLVSVCTAWPYSTAYTPFTIRPAHKAVKSVCPCPFVPQIEVVIFCQPLNGYPRRRNIDPESSPQSMACSALDPTAGDSQQVSYSARRSLHFHQERTET